MEQTAKNRSRRSFLNTLAALGGAGMAGSLLPEHLLAKAHLLTPADPERGHAFMTAPYLQDPQPRAMTVMWITNLPCYSWVEYGETGSLGEKAHSITNGLVDAYNRINRIQLRELKPATRYYYRVRSKEITGFEPYKLTYGTTIESKVFSFTTPAEQPEELNMLILNDIHDRPQSFPFLMNLHGNDPYDFVFLNGDMFNYQSDEQQIIDHLLTPCTGTFASQKPFMFVRGNHETRGKYRSDLHHYFYNPEGRQYFSFTWGPAHFTVLDTGEDKEDDAPVYAGIVDFDAYREEQRDWAGQVMQSRAFKKAKFRIVLMHIPMYNSGDWHGTMHLRELFTPVFNKHGVDICICGHTHRYGIHEPVPGSHNYPIIIGGGPKEGQRTIISLKADKKNLRLKMVADNGKEVGNYHLVSRRG